MNTAHAYRRDIDGLRGLSILLVVGFHAFPSWIRSGFIGVDIFFVISGYLIGQIVLEQVAARTFTFTGFYRRRILRIFPAVALTLVLVLLAGWLQAFPLAFKEIGKHVVGSAGFFVNHLLRLEAGYFDAAAESKPLLHLWSLAIEEQFYLTLPLLLIASTRFQRGRWLPAIVGACLAISLALNLCYFHFAPLGSYYSATGRFWELMAGVLLAVFAARGATCQWPGAASAAGCVLIAIACGAVNKDSGFPGWWAIVPVAGTCLVIWAGEHALPNRAVLSNRVLVAFGLISFPLYLFHWVTLYLLRDNLPGTPFTVRQGKFIALFVAMGLSWWVYRCVETPIRASRSGRAAMTLSLALACLAAAGAIVYANDGFPQRFAGNALMTETNQRNLTWFEPDAGCIETLDLQREKQRGASIFCSISAAGPVTVAVIGDSTANALFPGLASAMGARKQGVINLGAGNCPAIAGLQGTQALNRDCDAVAAKVDRYLQDHPSIRWIVFSAASWELAHLRVDGAGVSAADSGKYDALAARIAQGLRRWQTGGRKVVYIVDTPNLGFESVECIKNRSRCRVASRDLAFQDSTRRLGEALAATEPAPPGCSFEISALLTRDGAVSLLDASGRLLFRDTHHLSYSGSEWIGKEIAKAPCSTIGQPF